VVNAGGGGTLRENPTLGNIIDLTWGSRVLNGARFWGGLENKARVKTVRGPKHPKSRARLRGKGL